MAECILLKSNSGDGSDDCTATKAQVLTGHTAITKDSEDESVQGTMKNNNNWTSRIGVNGKVAIPVGYHSGAGYVDQAISNRGAVTTSLPINGSYTIPEGYHNGSGKVTQNITTMGAQTITPKNSAQTVSCNGKYMTGNVSVPAVSNLAAGNIKKGVNVGGVTGTFEGWVPGNGDVYNQGRFGLVSGVNAVPYLKSGDGVNWIATVLCKIAYEKGQIKLYAGYYNSLITNDQVNLTGFSTLNISFVIGNSGSSRDCILCTSTTQGIQLNYSLNIDAKIKSYCSNGVQKTLSLDVSHINGARYIAFGRYCGDVNSTNQAGLDSNYTYIYRIWLS